jgi:predicted O-linked N-acetylglucosamine transferase (SPINDLY family)
MINHDEALATALRLHQAGRLGEAEPIYQQILRADPNHVDALNLLGVLAQQRGNHERAIESIARAIRLDGSQPSFHNNLGNALRSQGRLAEAIASYQSALQLRPNYAEAYNNLGIALGEQGRLAEAIVSYQRALQLRPNNPEAYNNLGSALRSQGQLAEAIASYQRALELRPNNAEAHTNLGRAQRSQGQLAEAVASYQRALQLRPNYVEAHSGLLFSLLFYPELDARSLCEEHRRWGRQFAEPLARLIPPHTNEQSPHRRLRIGYISPNLRDHVIGHNLIPLFREHDHRQFEIFCYSDVTHPDDFTRRLREGADAWRDVVGRTDEQVAGLVREDGIDVFVDLTLHMGCNRLLVFARKPAPVQVTFAGYPGTTGLSAIDYRLTDPYLDPPAATVATSRNRSACRRPSGATIRRTTSRRSALSLGRPMGSSRSVASTNSPRSTPPCWRSGAGCSAPSRARAW